MTTTILTVRDIREIVTRVGVDRIMDDTIAALEQAFREFDPETTRVALREGFVYTEPRTGLLEWMPAMEVGRRATIKIVGYHPSNPERVSLPTILSTVALFDGQTGHLTGLLDGTYLTAVRTGAASAIASKFMAASNAKTLGLIGTGAQAVTQLHAISRLFDLDTVHLFDVVPGRTRHFAERVRTFLPPSIAVKSSPVEAVLAESDIVCTQTSVDIGAGPLFEDGPTKAHLHVNAVGSDVPKKTELPLSLLERSFVCPDFWEQAEREGECQQLSRDQVGATLTELVRSPDRFADVRDRSSVFDSTGFALEDQVAAALLLEHAEKLGLGTAVEIESTSEDPFNPYVFLDAPVAGKSPR